MSRCLIESSNFSNMFKNKERFYSVIKSCQCFKRDSNIDETFARMYACIYRNAYTLVGSHTDIHPMNCPTNCSVRRARPPLRSITRCLRINTLSSWEKAHPSNTLRASRARETCGVWEDHLLLRHIINKNTQQSQVLSLSTFSSFLSL